MSRSAAIDLLLVLLGGLFATLLVRSEGARYLRWLRILALAPGLGFGWAGLFCSAALLLGLEVPGWMGFGTASLLAFLALRMATATVRESIGALPTPVVGKPDRPGSVAARWVLLLLFGIASFSLVSAARSIELRHPVGGWDAVATWNYQALLIDQLGPRTPSASGAINYPLLLPASTALQWHLIGEASIEVPRRTASWYLVGTGLLLFLAVERRAGSVRAAGALALFYATPIALREGLAQLADLPLAYYLLAAALALEAQLFRNPTRMSAGCAGALLGFAASTKNEGLVWAAIAIFVYALFLARDSRRHSLVALGLGLSPALALLVLQRLDWASGRGLETSEFFGPGWQLRLIDPARWRLVLAAFEQRWISIRPHPLWGLTWLALAVAAILLVARWFLRTPPERAERFWLVLAGAWLCGLLPIYLLTPAPLEWHLATSLDRLLLQLFPALLVALALPLARPLATDEPPAIE